MIDHPTISLEHTGRGIVAADIDGIITRRKDVKITFSLLHAPTVCLRFTRYDCYESDIGKVFLTGQNNGFPETKRKN